ncbi:MAG TPA: four helix bundle protein [Burkholderiales bacterium]|jgi:four helix bundle protein|nr:four helix bundle protein [Burkholderiales bacterium]
MARPHESLQAWKEAMRLVRTIYDLTKTFPREEVYGLVAQMRRAAVSVPSNLAEGAARSSRKEFSQFLSVAKGSLSELETQLLISVDLGYLDRGNRVFNLAEQVAKLLAGLHRKALDSKDARE